MTSETEETALAEALAMTGLKTPAELIDMANVGQSLMERIADLVKQDGPFKGWMPADDPAEIVFDLVDHYEDAALSRAPEANKNLQIYLADLASIGRERKSPRLLNLVEAINHEVNAALSPGGEGEAVALKTEGWAALAQNRNIRLWSADFDTVHAFAMFNGCEVVRLVSASPEPVAISRDEATYLANLLEHDRDVGHCGEGTSERRQREIQNDRIDALVAKLQAPRQAAEHQPELLETLAAFVEFERRYDADERVTEAEVEAVTARATALIAATKRPARQP